MPHTHRFYVNPWDTPQSVIVLPPQEAHHALHVVRLREGDAVTLFDGAGTELRGCVAKVGRHDVEVSVHDRVNHPEPAACVSIVQAWLHRSDAIEELIRRGTEIGVRRFVFFRGKRSERAPKSSDKWVRWAIESCKQCGRFWLPEFSVAAELGGAIDTTGGAVIVATPHRESGGLAGAIAGPRVSLVIGPEGDFDPSELELAIARGAKPVSLGSAVYRAEVAAVLLATLVQYHLGEFGGFRNVK